MLDPSEVIEPYEESLNTKRQSERRAWAKGVVADILSRTDPGDTVVFLAGERYRENLLPELQNSGRITEIPMYGLRSGEQLQWLGEQTNGSVSASSQTSPARTSSTRTEKIRTENRQPSRETRLQDLRRFYHILDELRRGLKGGRLLSESSRADDWPQRGVYFFFESGEDRTDSGSGAKVVRVGTHAVSAGSKSTLWGRLKQHRGSNKGGGNHRGSVFRKLVGASLVQREPELAVESWGRGNTASGEVPLQERNLESRVSETLGAMPLLWVDIGDEPSKSSLRSYIERNSIALLSNFDCKEPLDRASDSWLGRHSPKVKIRQSDLWNSNHVDESYDPDFLNTFRELVSAQLERRPHNLVEPVSVQEDTPNPRTGPKPSKAPPMKTRGRGTESYHRIAARLPPDGVNQLTVSFSELEEWAEGRLIPSAYKHTAWWAGQRPAWALDGWRASPDFSHETVTFFRG